MQVISERLGGYDLFVYILILIVGGREMFEAKRLAEEMQEKLVAYRRHFHKYPELSFEEKETSQFIREHLNAAGIKMMQGIRGNSVVGILDGEKPGKTIAFRADMDALHMVEKNTDKPYCSTRPEVMHACGHDGHTAICLALAEVMAAHRQQIEGRVVFLFQQGEEKEPGGAKLLVEDGALNGVDYVVGLHMRPNYPVGVVAAKEGARTAAVDSFRLVIHGKGAHGARPHLSHDPIMCGVSVATELQQIVSRVSDPMKPVVITIGKFAGGHTSNVIPDEVELLVTVRSYDPDLRILVEERIREVVDCVCRLHHCTYDLLYKHGYPAMNTNQKSVDLIQSAAEEIGYEFWVGEASMGAEDFAYYLQVCDGCFFQLGCKDDQERDLHNPYFDIDEKCLGVGLACFLSVYNKLLMM